MIAALQNDIQTQRAATPSGKLVPRLLTAEQAGTSIGRSEAAVRHLIFQRDVPTVNIVDGDDISIAEVLLGAKVKAPKA